MRTRFLYAALLLTAATLVPAAGQNRFKPYAVSERKIEIGNNPAITLCKDGKADFEVVKPANPAAWRAVSELILRLQQITGKKVKPVAKASGKVPAFYLGRCPEAEKLGLKPENLDMDGYYIKTDGNRIFITGCDGRNGVIYQCSTLYGVYDFLERFAGVRYYFPGEIGTLVPKKKDWTLPEISIMERPDMQYRNIFCFPLTRLDCTKYYYPGLTKNNKVPSFWRTSHFNILSCHGLNDLKLAKRFAKTHPEYFAMTPDGRRHDGTYLTSGYEIHGHLCYSSKGLKEEIYQDMVAALTGKPASSRGIPKWTSRWTTESVNPSPNDGMFWCQCPECKKVQEKGKQAMSDHIWKFVIDLANRLKKDKIPGMVVFSGYSYFSILPTMEIPDNVIFDVAVPGPWGMKNPVSRAKADKDLKQWAAKVNHKVNTWAYPTKACATIPAVPNFTPRAVAAFYKSQKDNIFGGLFEAASDRWMFGFLNYYVFSKVMWNINTDVEALIDEHCRLMYGKAAPMMNQFYKEIEELWMTNIVKESYFTTLGENWKLPTEYEIWTKIYSPEKIKELNALLDSAEKAVSKDPESLKRVKFMRNELWQPAVDAAAAFLKQLSDRSVWTLYASGAEKITLDGKLDEKAWKKAEAVWLNVNRPTQKVEVQTRVKMLQDKDYFYFGFEADEPETERMVALSSRKEDDPEVWRDNGVEIFLAADLTSESIYQFIVNSVGAKSDLKNGLHHIDPKFDSGFEAKVQVIAGKMWTAEIRIPRKALPELAGKKQIVGNFTRNRVLKDRKLKTKYYVWFPKTRNTPENCGIIQVEKTERPVNLFRTGDFNYPVKGRHIGWWSSVKTIYADHEIFMTKGVSVRMEGPVSVISQSVAFEPGKKYKLSFYIRTEDLQPGFSGTIRFGGDPAPAYQVLGDYRVKLRGTNGWRRVEKVFRAPKKFGTRYKPHVNLSIGGKSTGKCWIDHTEIVEVKEP